MAVDHDDGAIADRALMDALFTPGGRSDPHDAMRLHPTLGCSHSVVTRVLLDPRTSAPAIDAPDEPLFELLRRFMARLDDERHRTTRARFSRLFTPKKASSFASVIEERADALIDSMTDAGPPAELVTSFARPLPFGVVADVLGIPRDDQPWMLAGLDTITAAFANQRDPTARHAGNERTVTVLAYFDDLLAHRRRAPADDLLSTFADEQIDDESHDDLLANCVFFLIAGHATTTALLAGGVALLCQHPRVLDHCRIDPHQWPATVDELLRLISPITITGVATPEDLDIDGRTFQRGPNRLLSFAAANRDPERFPDPDRLDTSRAPNPHLAFSVGPHHCIGAPLARLHGTIGLRLLFDRLPHLSPQDPPVWRGSAPVRQIEALTVTW